MATSPRTPNYAALLQRFYAVTDSPTTQPTTPTSSELLEDHPDDLAQFLEDQIQYEQVLSAQPAQFAELPPDLPPLLCSALRKNQIRQLYSHQRKCYDQIEKGQDVVVTTSTASGKSLCGLLYPLKAAMTQNQNTLAFYNLKALAADQSNAILRLLSKIPESERPKFAQLTGDTETDERQRILQTHPQILGMTPEFLHFQLRSVWNSEAWQQFFAGLRFVILDESHLAKGLFGSNLHLLIQRLKLVVDKYGKCDAAGKKPSTRLQFILLSATIGNPKEHARRLIGRPKHPERPDRLSWIKTSGAPTAEKKLTVLNPSSNINADTAKLVYHLMQQGRSGIVFSPSITACKRIYDLINQEAQQHGHQNVRMTVATYYSALKPQQRNAILENVRTRQTRWVIATDALEAGVDLPELDCCVLRGWTGSIQSFVQKSGRVGRRNRGAIFYIPVASSLLDIYHATHAEQLFSGNSEIVTFQVSIILLAKHLMCAAAESGLVIKEIKARFGKAALPVVQELISQEQIHRRRSGDLWAAGFPHRDLSFRGGTTQGSVQVIDQDGVELEQMSAESAVRELFKGSIYRAQNSEGKMITYESRELNLETQEARLCEIPETTTFTTADVQTQFTLHTPMGKPKQFPVDLSQITPSVQSSASLEMLLAWTDIRSILTGFDVKARRSTKICLNKKCLRYETAVEQRHCPSCDRLTRQRETVELIRSSLFETPLKIEMSTPVVQLQLDPQLRSQLKVQGDHLKAQIKAQHHPIPHQYLSLWEFPTDVVAMHTAGHQILKVLPLVVRSDSRDINFQLYPERSGVVGIFYNTIAESGAVENIFARFLELCARAIELAQTCPCESGCGNCLIQHGCPNQNQGLFKSLGIQLLQAIVSASSQ
jgi:DEAD/DEAH box helicase domain-containing protein